MASSSHLSKIETHALPATHKFNTLRVASKRDSQCWTLFAWEMALTKGMNMAYGRSLGKGDQRKLE